MLKKEPIARQFVSKIDIFLNDFKKTHPRSLSQQAEIDKYRNIHLRRDHPLSPPVPDSIMWD